MSILKRMSLSASILTFAVPAYAGFGDDSGNFGATLLIFAGLFILFMLLIREVNCWYWKINQRIELMEQSLSIQKDIRSMLRNLQEVPSTVDTMSSVAEADEIEARKQRVRGLKDRNVCPSCFKDYSKYILTCESCGIQLEQSAS
ncbi:hypothetical protein KP004_05700 [Geomonas oryzisoli]|uniref:Zinc ribbon domain-containing protein n=1 Tax=Geomonas oryzisoli TaxID=2847992 RepID=A0ABX8J8A4_9BACT|nr:hypothetical protein [Geomonas oryzisoli]QWV94673.1 hypothetical protein KP004_05700 [Geomonas oryzisoli]